VGWVTPHPGAVLRLGYRQRFGRDGSVQVDALLREPRGLRPLGDLPLNNAAGTSSKKSREGSSLRRNPSGRDGRAQQVEPLFGARNAT